MLYVVAIMRPVNAVVWKYWEQIIQQDWLHVPHQCVRYLKAPVLLIHCEIAIDNAGIPIADRRAGELGSHIHLRISVPTAWTSRSSRRTGETRSRVAMESGNK